MAPKAKKGAGAAPAPAPAPAPAAPPPSAASEASVDRKLKSVYEMIDSRNHKGALKQLQAILQKSKDNAHVLTIKAITLERMGRAEEALEVCRQVLALGAPALCNENILHDLQQVLARLGHGHEALGAYEVAAAARPENREIQQALFGALVRGEHFAKQQQVAMRLYKRRSGAEAERLIMTAVCSLMLQGMDASQLTGACCTAWELQDTSQRWHRRHAAIAHLLGLTADASSAVASSAVASSAVASSAGASSAAGAASTASGSGPGPGAGPAAAQAAQALKKQRAVLQLGEALCRKHIQEHGLRSLESLLLLVRVLKLQGKAGEALACLEGPHASLFTIPADLLREKADVLMELGSLREASQVFRELVHLKRADDWATTLHFLDASLLSALLAPSAAPGEASSPGQEASSPAPARGPDPDPAQEDSPGCAQGSPGPDAQAMRRLLGALFGDGAGGDAGGEAEAAGLCRRRLKEALASLGEAQEELHRAATSAPGVPGEHPQGSSAGRQDESTKVGNGTENGTENGNGNESGKGKGRSGEEGAPDGPSRGLMLADVEVAWRKWRLTSASGGGPQGDVSGLGGGEGALVDAVLQYFLRFGTKPCFASDARKYVAGLPPPAQRTLLGRLWASLGHTPGAPPWEAWARTRRSASGAEGPEGGKGAVTGEPEGGPVLGGVPGGGASAKEGVAASGLRELGALISALRAEELVGIALPPQTEEDTSSSDPAPVKGGTDEAGDSTSSREGVAQGPASGEAWDLRLSDAALVRRSAWAVQQYLGAPLGPAVDPKEQGEVDALLEVAANSLLEVYRRGGCKDQGLILLTARLLHLGLARRPFSPQHNIMLVCLYLVLGCPSLAIRHYGQLQAKHIQLDTLGHLLLPGLCQLASASSAPAWGETLRFFLQHLDLEAGELSLTAYTHGTFSKVPEFLRLKRRLASSHHFLWMRTQDSLARLVGAAAEPELAGITGTMEALEEEEEEGEGEGEKILGLGRGGADRLAGVVDRLASVSFNEDLSVRPWWHPAPDVVYLDSTAASPPRAAPTSWRPQESDAEKEARELRWSLLAASLGMLPRILSLALAPFLPPPPDPLAPLKQGPPNGLTPAQSLTELQGLAATWHNCVASQAADSAEHQGSSGSGTLEGHPQMGIAGTGLPVASNGQPNGAPGHSSVPGASSDVQTQTRGNTVTDPTVMPSLHGLRGLVVAATAVLREAAGGAPAGGTGPAGSSATAASAAASETSADAAPSSEPKPATTPAAEAVEGTAGEALAALGSFVRHESAFLCSLLGSQGVGEGNGEGRGGPEGGKESLGLGLGLQQPRGALPLATGVAGRVGEFTGHFLPLLVLCLRAWRTRGAPGASSKKTKEKGPKGAPSGGAPKVQPLCAPSAAALESLLRDTRGAVREIMGCLQQARGGMERLTGEKAGKASGTPDLGGLATLYTDMQTQAKSTMQYSLELNEARELLESIVKGGEGAIENLAEPNMSPLGLGSAQHLALVLGSQQGFVTSRCEQLQKLAAALGQL